MIAATKRNDFKVYENRDGVKVPRVSEVLNTLAKPALIGWIKAEFRAGRDPDKASEKARDSGSHAHAMIEAALKGDKATLAELEKPGETPEENKIISDAHTAYLKFLEWRDTVDIDPSSIRSELSLVSETYQYGGTIDIYCRLDGRPTLIDLKTSKAIYRDYWTQVAAYAHLLYDNDFDLEQCLILRIGKELSQGFQVGRINEDMLEVHFAKFLHALDILRVDRQLDELERLAKTMKVRRVA